MVMMFCFGVVATFHGDFVGFANGHVVVAAMSHM
jgi:hypothetical protein